MGSIWQLTVKKLRTVITNKMNMEYFMFVRGF